MSTPHVMKSMPQIVDTLTAETTDENSIHMQGTPEWLTKDYLENCLSTYYSDKKLKLKNVKAHPALGKGENFGGVLTRVKANFETSQNKEISGHYIIKTSYEADEFAREMMAPYDIFNREMKIYENVLPKLKKLLAEINDTEQIFSETIAVDYKRSALIFEDLNRRKFIMPNRLAGLDEKLTKIVLRKLAKMHATSAVLNERENGVLECFDRGMFNRHTENYKTAFVGLFEAGTALVSQWQGFKKFVKKLKALTPMVMELGKRAFDPIKGHVNVLAHGDLWTNNIMVKYDEKTGEPLDVIIIDFQYAAWASPAIDLYYLFNTSLKEEMHIGNQDVLIKYYYSIFEETLRKLEYKAPIPSLHRFHLQLQEKEFYAFSSTFMVLPVQRNEFTEDADFNALMKEDERGRKFKQTCYKNVYCERIIRQLLPVFEQRGLLDLDQ